MQGIDLDQVDTANMSEKLLHDMCGSAMTSTVVGTVMFAAFLTYHEAFHVDSRRRAIAEKEPAPSQQGQEYLETTHRNPAEYTTVPRLSLISLAAKTVRLCFCEGRHDNFLKTFQRCRQCGHTTCIKCGKLPKHDCEDFKPEVIRARRSPVEFEDLIKDNFPKEINIASLNTVGIDKFLQLLGQDTPKGYEDEQWEKILSAIGKALRCRVFFKGVRRAESWAITYQSREAILKFQVSGSTAYWELFTNVEEGASFKSSQKVFETLPHCSDVPEG